MARNSKTKAKGNNARRSAATPRTRKKPAAQASKAAAKKRKGAAKRKGSSTGKSTSSRKPVAVRKKRKRPRKSPASDPRIELAIKDMNRGASLTATARSHGLSRDSLQADLKKRRLVKRRKGRWVTQDNRKRRVPVMTDGQFRVLIVPNYKQSALVGAHHDAVGKFVRTNDISLIEPFEGKSVKAVSGRKYPLETDPNELHRLAAMDTPPFHEIYEITSAT